jgi:predicted GNAT superfamily acetyltransferase
VKTGLPRAIYPSDLSDGGSLAADLLALNNAHAQALSWLEPERFAHLVGQAFSARRIGRNDALLLAFDQDADYDSVNFLWFRSRYERFIYVDRVVVAPAARGRGYGRQLYIDLFEQASQAGHQRVVCEVNADPPNPVSDAFHAALGFAVVGSAAIHGGGKTVRYFSRNIDVSPVPYHRRD